MKLLAFAALFFVVLNVQAHSAPLVGKEIFVAINDINRDGTTVLFVEQNSKIALSTANRGYVMQTGEIVMSDTCKNLMENEEVQKAYLGV